MDAERTQTCTTCMHRHENQCRRYPPQVTVLMVPVKDALGRMAAQLGSKGAWPEAAADSWCGEWAGTYQRH